MLHLDEERKIVIITAPSGSGKTTLVKRLINNCPRLEFSISACTRSPRVGESNGKDYYFLSVPEFQKLIEQNAFVEWEMVYEGKYYGTLKSELDRIWQKKNVPLIDIDVKGALAIHDQFPQMATSVFIEAPSIEELRNRLIKRGTETAKSLEERVEKARTELTFAPKFDHILVNDELNQATKELTSIVSSFIGF